MDTVEKLVQVLYLNDFPEYKFKIATLNTNPNEPNIPPFRASLTFGDKILTIPEINEPYENVLPLISEAALKTLYPKNYHIQPKNISTSKSFKTTQIQVQDWQKQLISYRESLTNIYKKVGLPQNNKKEFLTLNNKRKVDLTNVSTDTLIQHEKLNFYRSIKKPDSISLFQSLQGPISQNYGYTCKIEFLRDGQLVKTRVAKGVLKLTENDTGEVISVVDCAVVVGDKKEKKLQPLIREILAKKCIEKLERLGLIRSIDYFDFQNECRQLKVLKRLDAKIYGKKVELPKITKRFGMADQVNRNRVENCTGNENKTGNQAEIAYLNDNPNNNFFVGFKESDSVPKCLQSFKTQYSSSVRVPSIKPMKSKPKVPQKKAKKRSAHELNQVKFCSKCFPRNCGCEVQTLQNPDQTSCRDPTETMNGMYKIHGKNHRKSGFGEKTNFQPNFQPPFAEKPKKSTIFNQKQVNFQPSYELDRQLHAQYKKHQETSEYKIKLAQMQRKKFQAQQKFREEAKSKIDKVAVMFNVHNADLTERYGSAALKLTVNEGSTLTYKGPDNQAGRCENEVFEKFHRSVGGSGGAESWAVGVETGFAKNLTDRRIPTGEKFVIDPNDDWWKEKTRIGPKNGAD
jgi:hypothetical protein